MRAPLIFTLLSVVGGLALAQSAQSRPPEDGMMCLSTNGQRSPSICRRGNAWGDSDICTCRGGAMRYDAPICARGEKPPAESVALDRARAEAMKRGTLYGATFEGRRMCVEVKRPG
jgi:hypothetical protein